MSYIAKARSRAQIRETARLIRKLQGAESELYFPILDFMEKTLPMINPAFSFRVIPEDEMGECEGLKLPEKNEILIRSDVYDRAYDGGGRERLTIAHELYHYLQHSKQTIAFARTNGQPIPAYKDPEWQADAFGGELLVSYDLARELSVEEIVGSCGVSEAAAKTQYKKMH